MEYECEDIGYIDLEQYKLHERHCGIVLFPIQLPSKCKKIVVLNTAVLVD